MDSQQFSKSDFVPTLHNLTTTPGIPEILKNPYLLAKMTANEPPSGQ